MKNIFKSMSKTLLAVIVLSGLILGTSLAVAVINLTYNMSAPTQSQALSLYVDSATTVEINPVTFNWGAQGYIISNDSTISCYAFLSENLPVTLNVTIVPLTNVSCSVAYSPMFFQITSNATQQITMMFENVVSNTTATWTFSLSAVPA